MRGRFANVVFDGKIIDHGFTAGYAPTFGGTGDDIRAVEDLPEVRELKMATWTGATVEPDPAQSPQPALETIAPRWVTEGDPTTTITLTGFNFVDRSEVLIDGTPVPHERVSDTELAVTVDANLLQNAGRWTSSSSTPNRWPTPIWATEPRTRPTSWWIIGTDRYRGVVTRRTSVTFGAPTKLAEQCRMPARRDAVIPQSVQGAAI